MIITRWLRFWSKDLQIAWREHGDFRYPRWDGFWSKVSWWASRLSLVALLLGFVALAAAGALLHAFRTETPSIILGGVSFCLFCLGLGIPIAIYIQRSVRSTFAAARVALEPVPDPYYIAQQLRVEYGREPTVVEVNAVHQMLVSRRNEAAARAAVGVGAFVLLHDAADRANGH